jgi:hypothetical protein
MVASATWIEVVMSSEMFLPSSLSPVCKHWNVSGRDYNFSGNELDGPAIESRWGDIFAPVQTCPGAHPKNRYIPNGKVAGAWSLSATQSSAKVKESV